MAVMETDVEGGGLLHYPSLNYAAWTDDHMLGNHMGPER